MNQAERFGSFVSTVTSIYRTIRRIKQQRIRGLGLRIGDIMVLFHLSKKPEGMTAAELCRETGDDKAETSRVLAALVEQGYVSYLPSATRYRARAVLTEKGTVLMTDTLNGMIAEAVTVAGCDLTEDDRRILYCSLSRIASRLEQLAGTGEPSPADTGNKKE